MSFSAPVEDRWFEDYVPGTVHAFGAMAVEEDEVLAFGRRFDPQPFHRDARAAMRTEYRGLIASGWHTAALMMRMYSDHYLSHVATLVSPGVDELRWLRPVRPGRRAVDSSDDRRGAAVAVQAGPRRGPLRRGGAEPARRGGDDGDRAELLSLPRRRAGSGSGSSGVRSTPAADRWRETGKRLRWIR